MPVIGFTNEPFNNTDSKKIITFGKLEGVDTTSTVSTLNPNGETWVVNDALYMNSTAGGLTKVRPTGTNFIQRIAKVLRVDASGGQIFIFNTARTAGLPNLTTDNVWVGDANGYPQMVNKSTLGGDTIYTADGQIDDSTRTVDLDGNLLRLIDVTSDRGIQLTDNISTYSANQFELKSTFAQTSAGIVMNASPSNTQFILRQDGNIHHWIRTESAQIVNFFRVGYWGNGFIVGDSARIGTENISLQGITYIKGNGTGTGITLALYDDDTTPNKNWEWLDNGTMRGYNGARIEDAIINPSVQETTSTATFTINADEETDGVLTAMATNTTIASPTGTPVQSQSLIFRFKDDGTSRTLTWNAIFRAIGVTLPTATTANKLLYVGCKYNSTDTKWDVVSVQEET